MDVHAAPTATLGSGARLLRAAARVVPFALAGLLLFVLRKQLPSSAVALAKSRPIALWSLVFFFAWNHVATLSWRALLRSVGARGVGFGDLVRARIEAQAVNQLVPSAGVAGEALRAVRASGGRDLGASTLATILDNTAGVVSGLLFAFAAFAFHVEARHGEARVNALMTAAGAALAVFVVAVLVPLYFAPRWLPRASFTKPFRDVLDASRNRPYEIRRAFRSAVGFRMLERILAIGEIYVVFHAVGAPITVGDAAVVSAVLVTTSFVVFFSPGQIGAAEAATVATSSLLGIPPALSLSASVLRRVRQLVVCVLGGALIVLRKRKSERFAAVRPGEEIT